MKNVLHCLILAALILAASSQADAQRRFTRHKRYWSVGGWANAANYFGEVVPSSSITSVTWKLTRPSLGAIATKRINQNFSFRAALTWVKISGDDFEAADPTDPDSQPRWLRNLHFRNDMIELQGGFVYDLFENRGLYFKRPKVPIPYFALGLAVVYSNPQAKYPQQIYQTNNPGDGPVSTGYPDKWAYLRQFRTEGVNYSPIVIAIPVGVGVRYKLTSHLDLGFEISYRIVFSDYLDDISNKYIDPRSFPDYQDYTQSPAYYFANRSLEATAARSGQVRNLFDYATPRQIPVLNEAGQVDGTIWYVSGFGAKGDQRGGNKANDSYMTAGVSLTYILAGGIRSPKFR